MQVRYVPIQPYILVHLQSPTLQLVGWIVHLIKQSSNTINMEKLQKTLQTLFLIPAGCLVFMIWIPFFFHCLFVKLYVKLFKKSYGNILNPMGSSVKNNFEVPNSNGVLFTLTLDGEITLDAVKILFENNVIDAKITDGKETKVQYP